MDDAPLPNHSRLISNSKYLNHAGLRDWCGEDMLRRNGPDQNGPGNGYRMIRMLEDELQGDERVERLLEDERKAHPRLDAWLARGHIPSFTKDDLKGLPQGSVGQKLYDYVLSHDLELDFHPPMPNTLYALTRLMRGRSHDIEHILLGAGFNALGELVPAYYCITQLHREFSPALAGELAQLYKLISLRYTVRTVLHYPDTWPTAFDCIERGIRAGAESDLNFMTDFEPYLAMSVPEARAALGIRGVEDIDIDEISQRWSDASQYAGRKEG